MNKHIGAVIVLIAGFALIVIGNLIYFSLVEELNARLRPEDRINAAFSGGRWLAITNQHGREFPVSPKRRLMYGCFLAGALMMVVAFCVL